MDTLDFVEIVCKGICKGSEGESVKHFLGHSSKAAGSVDEESHSINFVISTDEVDRDNEIVTVAAIALAVKGDFAKNPVALAGHEHRLENGMPPAVGSWNVSTFKAFKHHSEMRLYFAVDTELGLEYWKLYSKWHMRAVSIGYRPIEWQDVQDAQHGRVRKFTKLELVEISVVAVGANANALSKSKQGKAEFVQEKIDEAIYDKIMADADWDAIEEEEAALEQDLSNKSAEFRKGFDLECQEFAEAMFASDEGEEAEDNKNELLDLIGHKQLSEDYVDYAALVSGC
jgi:hypothetical protein